MSSKQRRERERDEVRTRILDAARRLFLTDGYDAVSMRKIAEAIEYSPTAIYQYFTDKTALVLALCDADFEAWAGQFAVLKDVADPVERIRRMGRTYIRFAVENPGHYRLMFMSDHLGTLDPAAVRAAYEADDGKNDPDRNSYLMLVQAVGQAMAAGQFRQGDPMLVAQTLWQALHGLCALHITHANDPWPQWRALDARIDHMIDMIIRGLSATDGNGPRRDTRGHE
jgi:AcrR family transcriptional regulator